MPTYPLRGLGAGGIIKDIGPYNLPPQAWSAGNNVRFEHGRVRRSPGFRTVDASPSATPYFMFGANPSSANDYILYTDASGNMYKYRGSHSDITPASGFTPTSSDQVFTGAFLDNCAYINRNTDVPYVLLDGATAVVPLTDYGWNADWRAGVIRSFSDFVIALDVTKGATEYPNMVKWSSAVTGDGSPPASWAETDTTILAGENPLPDLQGRLLDGRALKNSFMLYSNNDVWRMQQTSGRFVFRFERLFDDLGILGTNCVAEVDGLHYVFGEHDIYIHDGTRPQSIATGQVQDFVFQSMRKELKKTFWVARNPILKEVIFAYCANDGDANWINTSFPNRAAIFNYREQSWSFVDLPSVVGTAEIILANTTAWDDVTTTWDNTGGTWDGNSDEARTGLFMMSSANSTAGVSTSSIYAYDTIENGSVQKYPLDLDVIAPAYVERQGYDLDDILPGITINQHKNIDRLYPQARAFSDEPLNFKVGSSMTAWGDVTYGDTLTFNGETQYKLDVRRGGRYLALHISMDAPHDFWFSGADIGIKTRGRR